MADGVEEEDPLLGEAEEEEEREVLARSLAKRVAPSEAIQYNVEESALWEHRHISAGSVLSFRLVDEETGLDQGEVAVLVQDVMNANDGMTVRTSLAGAEEVGTRARLQADYRKGKNELHICYTDGGVCKVADRPCIHLKRFTWHPPGTFKRSWLTQSGKKAVRDGATMLGAPPLKPSGRRRPALKPSGAEEDVPPGAGGELGDRLRAIREKVQPRITFAGSPPVRKSLGQSESRGPRLARPHYWRYQMLQWQVEPW